MGAQARPQNKIAQGHLHCALSQVLDSLPVEQCRFSALHPPAQTRQAIALAPGVVAAFQGLNCVRLQATTRYRVAQLCIFTFALVFLLASHFRCRG